MTGTSALAATLVLVTVGGGIEHSSARRIDATAALAVRACGDYVELRGVLADQFGEQPASSGLAEDGTLMQIFASATTDTWTMIKVTPSGQACVLAVGRDWQNMLNLAQDQPA
jgi:hypothetical protein